ncbi:hypothetical protein [Stackebrandtia soli]|uniref:hypothetical protein n=1 Tax=Stackebrandtia soli TaxID=1892856 RepID=UPI0039ED6667
MARISITIDEEELKRAATALGTIDAESTVARALELVAAPRAGERVDTAFLDELRAGRYGSVIDERLVTHAWW